MYMRRGFTLIELSVILVIIGMLTAAIIVSQDLIRTAQLRKQVSQISDYRLAVSNFQAKYGFLPGDMPNPIASKYNFATGRTEVQGRGDGNGILQDPDLGTSLTGINVPNGELGMFWVDLYRSGLITDIFNTATVAGTPVLTASSSWAAYLPETKIKPAGYVYAYSVNDSPTATHPFPTRTNLFGISGGLSRSGGLTVGSPTFTVSDAAFIDSKIDDGLPMSGTVMATYIGGVTVTHAISLGSQMSSSIAPSVTTCYDNASNTIAMRYSTSQNNGKGINCGLSFMMQ